MTNYAYIRVSTEMQDFDAQKSAIERKYKVDRWMSDVGTGKVTQPNLLRLCEMVKKDDVVIIYAFDRLGRSTGRVMEIADRFKARGAGLISLREGVDINSPSGNMLFQVLCSIAEFEATLISNRVRSGLQAAALRGVKLGRPKLKESDIGNARLYRAQGMSYQRIVRQLQKDGIKVSYGSLYRCIGAGNEKSENREPTGIG